MEKIHRVFTDNPAIVKLIGAALGSLAICLLAFTLPANLIELYQRNNLIGGLLRNGGLSGFLRFSAAFISVGLLYFLGLRAAYQTSSKRFGILTLPRLDSWTGWWLFCGLIGLTYTFFIEWKKVTLAIQFEFLPLYIILFINLVISLWKKFSAYSLTTRQSSN